MPLTRMVGQLVMARMSGLSPDRGLLGRIHAGHLGGVILYGEDIASPGQVARLDRQLQRAARSGGNPPLLISTDQEGGAVKRLPWAPPTISPPGMGARSPRVAQAQGRGTGAALKAAGINVDLAPVADVAHSSASFIWRQGRSFGMNAAAVTARVQAFSSGMEMAGVAPTAKHFPGVGAATTDTDYALDRINLSPKDLTPYRTLIPRQIPLIMVSTAVYQNLDRASPAALSHPIVAGLLRGQLRYRGVVISDDLERPTGKSTGDAAVAAARAGVDIILVSSTESSGPAAYQALLRAAERGRLSRQAVTASYQRVLDLKRRYAH